eukprot:1791750-Prymnesium_polylepis.1
MPGPSGPRARGRRAAPWRARGCHPHRALGAATSPGSARPAPAPSPTCAATLPSRHPGSVVARADQPEVGDVRGVPQRLGGDVQQCGVHVDGRGIIRHRVGHNIVLLPASSRDE